MKKIIHMGTKSSASFGIFGSIAGAAKRAVTGAKNIPSAVIGTVANAQTSKINNIDRIVGLGTMATIPFGIASLAVPSADTRAVQDMRKMDMDREAKGLAPLPINPQMIAENAQKANQVASTTNTVNGVMTANPVPARLPGELPPGSMRQLV